MWRMKSKFWSVIPNYTSRVCRTMRFSIQYRHVQYLIQTKPQKIVNDRTQNCNTSTSEALINKDIIYTLEITDNLKDVSWVHLNCFPGRNIHCSIGTLNQSTQLLGAISKHEVFVMFVQLLATVTTMTFQVNVVATHHNDLRWGDQCRG